MKTIAGRNKIWIFAWLPTSQPITNVEPYTCVWYNSCNRSRKQMKNGSRISSVRSRSANCNSWPAKLLLLMCKKSNINSAESFYFRRKKLLWQIKIAKRPQIRLRLIISDGLVFDFEKESVNVLKIALVEVSVFWKKVFCLNLDASHLQKSLNLYNCADQT